MSTPRILATAALLLAATTAVRAESPNLGQPLAPEEIPLYAVYVLPDGRGLPPGGGTALEGEALYQGFCAACHGATGVEGPITPPVGPNEIWPKPAGRHWPYATTLFDYIRRAMPFNAPKSLTDEEVYAITAYILHRNGLIPEDAEMNGQTLPQVQMPKRDGFIDVWEKQGERPW